MGLGDKHFLRMADGTIKQLNPFTGTEVWTVATRSLRLEDPLPGQAEPLDPDRPEDYCHFCETNWATTPPEKTRLIREAGQWVMLHNVPHSGLHATCAEFRRLPKLLELLGHAYWTANYGYELSGRAKAWRDQYLSDPAAREALITVLHKKYEGAGRSKDELAARLGEKSLSVLDPFFGGTHELVIPRRHYQSGATDRSRVEYSGSLTPDQHHQYFLLTTHALQEIHRENRYVRYVSTYQNYLDGAGASCDHLHKQLVGLDEWGFQLEREVQQLRTERNIYNRLAANLAIYNNLVVADNDHAVAIVEFGQRWPTVSVFSKSRSGRPDEHSPAELRAVSDMVHAMHAAAHSRVPSTEEWYYQPRDLTLPMPWRVLIRWRITVPSGFEGGTRIYVNPMSPWELRDLVVARLLKARERNAIALISIGEECPSEPNPLQYYRRD